MLFLSHSIFSVLQHHFFTSCSTRLKGLNSVLGGEVTWVPPRRLRDGRTVSPCPAAARSLHQGPFVGDHGRQPLAQWPAGWRAIQPQSWRVAEAFVEASSQLGVPLCLALPLPFLPLCRHPHLPIHPASPVCFLGNPRCHCHMVWYQLGDAF